MPERSSTQWPVPSHVHGAVEQRLPAPRHSPSVVQVGPTRPNAKFVMTSPATNVRATLDRRRRHQERHRGGAEEQRGGIAVGDARDGCVRVERAEPRHGRDVDERRDLTERDAVGVGRRRQHASGREEPRVGLVLVVGVEADVDRRRQVRHAVEEARAHVVAGRRRREVVLDEGHARRGARSRARDGRAGQHADQHGRVERAGRDRSAVRADGQHRRRCSPCRGALAERDEGHVLAAVETDLVAEARRVEDRCRQVGRDAGIGESAVAHQARVRRAEDVRRGRGDAGARDRRQAHREVRARRDQVHEPDVCAPEADPSGVHRRRATVVGRRGRIPQRADVGRLRGRATPGERDHDEPEDSPVRPLHERLRQAAPPGRIRQLGARAELRGAATRRPSRRARDSGRGSAAAACSPCRDRPPRSCRRRRARCRRRACPRR